MSSLITNIGHGIAAAAKEIAHEAKVVEQFVLKLNLSPQAQSTIEAVSSVIPVYGPAVANLERIGFALFGEVSKVFAAGDAAAKAKLMDAGLDIEVMKAAEQVFNDVKAALVSKGALPIPASTTVPTRIG